jgi:soluble lytic murein transglycosylase-like protein
MISQIVSVTKDQCILFTNIPLVEGTEPDHRNYDDGYDHIIRYYCQIHGVDQQLVKLIIEKESNFNPRAVSHRGAVGLMQIMPETARVLGVRNLYDPWQNIEGGVKYLRRLFEMFDGDLELVLAAYHAGPGLVKRLGRVPVIPETMAYVDYILSRYNPTEKSSPIYFMLTPDGTPFFTNLPK